MLAALGAGKLSRKNVTGGLGYMRTSSVKKRSNDVQVSKKRRPGKESDG